MRRLSFLFISFSLSPVPLIRTTADDARPPAPGVGGFWFAEHKNEGGYHPSTHFLLLDCAVLIGRLFVVFFFFTLVLLHDDDDVYSAVSLLSSWLIDRLVVVCSRSFFWVD